MENVENYLRSFGKYVVQQARSNLTKAKKNVDKKVKMEWGNWFPTKNVLKILEVRRDRIKNGSLNAEYRLYKYLNGEEKS